jgi:hypothetical protein
MELNVLQRHLRPAAAAACHRQCHSVHMHTQAASSTALHCHTSTHPPIAAIAAQHLPGWPAEVLPWHTLSDCCCCCCCCLHTQPQKPLLQVEQNMLYYARHTYRRRHSLEPTRLCRRLMSIKFDSQLRAAASGKLQLFVIWLVTRRLARARGQYIMRTPRRNEDTSTSTNQTHRHDYCRYTRYIRNQASETDMQRNLAGRQGPA